MDLSLTIPDTNDRRTLFTALGPQFASLLEGEKDTIAMMANVCSVLKDAFNWHWVGFYRVVGEELVLGPFQGPVACTRIPFGKGVCGSAWKEDRTQVVEDVDRFPGHIACSPLSRSEVVIPLHDRDRRVIAVLDIDSTRLNDFSAEDVLELERLVTLMEVVY